VHRSRNPFALWRRQDGAEFVLQTAEADEWADLHGFVPEPVPLVDLETSNWFSSTHPRSPFVTGLVVSIQDAHGTRTSLSDWDELALKEQTPDGTRVTPVELESVRALLASHFGLGGFVLGAGGRLVLA
jgi:arylamine N-acetyltransferase